MMVYLVMDGEQVRELRQKKRMSQRQLAAEANVSKKTISDVEAGKVRPPGLDGTQDSSGPSG
jgi:transcriptional regulator with XRE-family HTH domain